MISGLRRHLDGGVVKICIKLFEVVFDLDDFIAF